MKTKSGDITPSQKEVLLISWCSYDRLCDSWTPDMTHSSFHCDPPTIQATPFCFSNFKSRTRLWKIEWCHGNSCGESQLPSSSVKVPPGCRVEAGCLQVLDCYKHITWDVLDARAFTLDEQVDEKLEKRRALNHTRKESALAGVGKQETLLMNTVCQWNSIHDKNLFKRNLHKTHAVR